MTLEAKNTANFTDNFEDYISDAAPDGDLTQFSLKEYWSHVIEESENFPTIKNILSRLLGYNKSGWFKGNPPDLIILRNSYVI